ncbi:MAG: DUF4372 domain-containing protein, partial [Gammaproteobacteria bacterium]
MNRFCSMFSQILKLFPRSEFERLVRETQAERHARGFSSWGQFVAMLFWACPFAAGNLSRFIDLRGEALASRDRGPQTLLARLCQ